MSAADRPTLERTERFARAFKRLSPQDRERVAKALQRLASDPRHPALRVKRIRGTFDIWEARASDDLRITFQMAPGRILLRNTGCHDPTLRKP